MSERVTAPSSEDPFVRGLTEFVGGPVGSHAVPERPDRRGRFWTAARIVLALTCLTLALHWLQKSPCRDGAWHDNLQYTKFCYTDVLALYGAEGLADGKVPYLPEPDGQPADRAVEYPVLTGVMMGIIGLPIHALGANNPGLNQYQAFYDVTALALAAFAVATVGLILSMRRRRPWDAAMFALSPVLLVTATVNWDFLAIVLATTGLWLWARGKPIGLHTRTTFTSWPAKSSEKSWPKYLIGAARAVLKFLLALFRAWGYPIFAGVFIGLGASAKLWPVFLFGPIFVLAFRARRMGSALAAFGAGAVTWLLLNVPIMLINMPAWQRFWKLNDERSIDWGTSWYVARFLDSDVLGKGESIGLWNDISTVNKLSLVLFILGCLGVALLGVAAKQAPRLAQLAFLVVAIFLITNKVWSQQFTLWLLPLLILARPKWGAFLVWQIAEVGYFLAFYGELLGASGSQVFPEGVFILASMLRLGTVIALVVLVVRDVLQPERDAVRKTYRGDPDAGVLQGEDDRVVSVLPLNPKIVYGSR